MRRVRALSLAVPALLCAGLGASPAASAQDVPARILADVRKDGRVGPCDHPEAAVRRALEELPADADVLAPDLRAQLEASAEAHTSGRCTARRVSGDGEPAGAAGGTGAGVPGSGAAAAQEEADAAAAAAEDRPEGSPDQANPTPQPAPPNAAAPAARDNAIARAAQAEPARTAPGDAPAPLWLLLVLALLAALAALAWTVLRASGSELPGLGRGRHARREAAWRASNAWSEFTDWVRLGR
jgi:hypothetical protein